MKQSTLRLFAFAAIIMVVSLACIGNITTPTQAPVDNPPVNNPPVENSPVPPPEQPTPAPTEPPVEPVSAQDYFTEEFDGDISNWSYFTTKNDSTADDTGAQPFTEDGFLVMDIGKYLNVYALYDPYIYDNVRLDVRVDNRGTNNNNINLVCRYSDEGWYEIAIANNGLFWLYAYDAAKGNYVKLADGGSNKIKAGKEVNEYTFICNDRNLKLSINGFETTTYTDNQFVFRDGQIGVGLSSFNDVPVKVEFDWIKIGQP
ncbi:MAG: hypothetical protein HZB19_14680 [Chloroflexi bacterium]|nr:hypothetical protein [Chloroflexota bacterium]